MAGLHRELYRWPWLRDPLHRRHGVRRLVRLATLSALVLGHCGSATDSERSDDLRQVSFPTRDGGRIFANLYGAGDPGVVLAHGAVFDKESWHPLATQLATAGYAALAIDFRGYGDSEPGSKQRGLDEDVLAAVRYLRGAGLEPVSVIGASMGAMAAGRAAAAAEAGEIDRLILLAPGHFEGAESMKAREIFFIVTRGDRLRPTVEALFRRAPEPKRLEILEGASHAQHIFRSEQAEVLRQLLFAFLEEDS